LKGFVIVLPALGWILLPEKEPINGLRKRKKADFGPRLLNPVN